MEEAQRIRGLKTAFSGPDINWSDLEDMGYTPLSVLKALGNAHTLLGNRRAIVEQNTVYVERFRLLKSQHDLMVSNIKRAVKVLP